MNRAHMEYASRVGAQIQKILHRYGIPTEGRVDRLDGGIFTACWEVRRDNAVLEWSIGHDGGDGTADFLAVVLRIEAPGNQDYTLQQFKLLLKLSTRTWHRSTAGQLGFALGYGESDPDDTSAIEEVEKLARWFAKPDHATPKLPSKRDESDL